MKRLITIISLVLVLAITASACSADMGAPAPSAPAPSAPAAADSPASARWGEAAMEAPAEVVAGGGAPVAEAAEDFDAESESVFHDFEEPAVALPLLTPSASMGRRIVYTVEMQIQTTEFMPGKRLLLTTLANFGGWVESEHLEGRDMRFPGTERNVRYTLRIHSDHLSEFLVTVEDNFNLVMRRQLSEDVTESYEHSEATVDDLRGQEARIRADLEDEDSEISAADRRTLERRMSEIQSSIRNHERRIRTYDIHVMYSTLHVHMFEVIFPEEQIIEEIEIEEPTFGDRFNAAVTRSLDGVVSFFQGVAIVVVLILPTLLILAAAAAVALAIIFAVKKAGKKRKTNKPESPKLKNMHRENLNRGNFNGENPYRENPNHENQDNEDVNNKD